MMVRWLVVAGCVAIVAGGTWPDGITPAQAAGEEGRTSSNPLSGQEEAVAAGQTMYRANCGLCHGMRADGRGRGLPNSADLRKFKRGYSKFVQAVKEGYKTMPAWGGMGAISDEQIAQIGAYLETLAGRRANWVDPPDTSEAEPQAAITPAATPPPEPKDYEVHLSHILNSWSDAPGEVGLTTVLEQEASIAGEHAAYAVTDLEDLANIQVHTRHVRHAIDPMTESGGGPGAGYGIVKAAADIIEQIELARDAKDASDSVILHSEHVLASIRNVQFWAGKSLDKAGQILGGASPVASAFYAEEIVERIEWILNGRDADGDGNITWHEGEGGLAQAREHLSYIE